MKKIIWIFLLGGVGIFLLNFLLRAQQEVPLDAAIAQKLETVLAGQSKIQEKLDKILSTQEEIKNQLEVIKIRSFRK